MPELKRDCMLEASPRMAADMAAPSHLCLVLEPAALSRVLDRLAVLDLIPDTLCFERRHAGEAILQMAWDDFDAAKAANLRDRLAQFPSVSAVVLMESSLTKPHLHTATND